MARGKDDAKNAKRYAEDAKKQIVYETAASAWSAGVPWAEALGMATRVMDKACVKPKAKAKPKAKPKARAKSRSWLCLYFLYARVVISGW